MMNFEEPLFIDTNVIIQVHISTAPRHLDARRVLRWLIERLVPLWISRQVLRECAAVVTRPQPYAQPMSVKDAAALLRHLAKAYFVADETSDVTDHLLTLMETVAIGGRQVHDANIAATMLAYSVPRLLTLNAPDFERFTPRVAVLASAG